MKILRSTHVKVSSAPITVVAPEMPYTLLTLHCEQREGLYALVAGGERAFLTFARDQYQQPALTVRDGRRMWRQVVARAKREAQRETRELGGVQ